MSYALQAPIRAEPSVKALFPNFCAFAVEIHELDSVDASAARALLVDDANASLSEINIEALSHHPRIAVWREAYRRMGLKASEYRSSVEQLVRRSARGQLFETGNWLVDLYNRISIAKLVPMGGYDFGKQGPSPIKIRTLSPADVFEPIGDQSKQYPMRSDIVGYAADNNILCWALNHRDAHKYALKPNSKSALFVSEAIDRSGAISSLEAIQSIAAALSNLGAQCGEILEI